MQFSCAARLETEAIQFRLLPGRVLFWLRAVCAIVKRLCKKR